MIINKKYILSSLATISTLTTTFVHAQCPVCTVAVIGGVGLARWLKIDDSITGLWIGGLLVSVSIWTINWLKTKKWDFPFSSFLVPALYYAAAIIPLYIYKIIGHPANALWGFDKIVLGTMIGSVFFYMSTLRYGEIKKKNKGHAQFPFQHIVMSISTLVVLSGIMYLITRH
ncbi:MAG: hypothetical protein WCP93_02325 [Candidatus Berkelbacteria bacterium]